MSPSATHAISIWAAFCFLSQVPPTFNHLSCAGCTYCCHCDDFHHDLPHQRQIYCGRQKGNGYVLLFIYGGCTFGILAALQYHRLFFYGLQSTLLDDFQYFAAIQVAFICTTFWILLLNGFVGFQLAEDGTPASVWVNRV